MTNDQYMSYQEGGEMKPVPYNPEDSTGPKIGSNTIDMKIQLVNDATLPSYLIPNLTCDDGSTNITGSKVSITLTGNSLRQEKTAPGDFTCEITSNFLTKGEKSAITIETYYLPSDADSRVTNTIYFDESLLKSYNTSKQLILSPNPFLSKANSATTSGGVLYLHLR